MGSPAVASGAASFLVALMASYWATRNLIGGGKCSWGPRGSAPLEPLGLAWEWIAGGATKLGNLLPAGAREGEQSSRVFCDSPPHGVPCNGSQVGGAALCPGAKGQRRKGRGTHRGSPRVGEGEVRERERGAAPREGEVRGSSGIRAVASSARELRVGGPPWSASRGASSRRRLLAFPDLPEGELGSGSAADSALFQAAIQGERARMAQEDQTYHTSSTTTSSSSSSSGSSSSSSSSSSSWENDGQNDGQNDDDLAPSSARKLAFLFATRGGLPLADLWCQFLYGHEDSFSVYIHGGPKSGPLLARLPACLAGTVIPAQEPNATNMAEVDVHRRLLAHALLDPDNTRFILLSPWCIPIFNFFFMRNYLLNTPQSFVKGAHAEGRSGKGRWHQGFLPTVTREAFRKGVPWFVLTRRLALEAISDVEYYRVFKEQCVWTPHKCCCLEEHYIPTLLHAKAPPGLLADRSLTWTQWTVFSRLIVTLGKNEVKPGMLDRVRSKPKCTWNENPRAYCYLFARRLAPDALVPLLSLGSSMGY